MNAPSSVYVVQAYGGEWSDHWQYTVGVAYSLPGAEAIAEDYIERLDEERQKWGAIACEGVDIFEFDIMETYESDKNRKFPSHAKRIEPPCGS